MPCIPFSISDLQHWLQVPMVHTFRLFERSSITIDIRVKLWMY